VVVLLKTLHAPLQVALPPGSTPCSEQLVDFLHVDWLCLEEPNLRSVRASGFSGPAKASWMSSAVRQRVTCMCKAYTLQML
jgi:hypothetical protein